MPEGNAIRSMFAGIAGRYDFANHFLSGGIDFYWRKVLVKLVQQTRPQTIVDLATGSGDVAFALKKRIPEAQITGMDFCREMLDEAELKKEKAKTFKAIDFKLGDCMSLPLPDASLDAVTIAFGVRNFEDRDKGLKELYRILKPGGSLFILEFSQPDKWFRPFYYIYLKYLLPLVAGITTGKRDAYAYLAGSIEQFPEKASLSEQIKKAGFPRVEATGLTFSTVAIHQATR